MNIIISIYRTQSKAFMAKRLLLISSRSFSLSPVSGVADGGGEESLVLWRGRNETASVGLCSKGEYEKADFNG